LVFVRLQWASNPGEHEGRKQKRCPRHRESRLGSACPRRSGLAERGKTRPAPTLGELFDALEADFKLRGIDTARNRSTLKSAREAFPSTMKAIALTTDDVNRYIEKRQRQRPASATISRMTLLLGQAVRNAKLTAPETTHLSEKGNEPRDFSRRTNLLGSSSICQTISKTSAPTIPGTPSSRWIVLVTHVAIFLYRFIGAVLIGAEL
jgi:hypothetical protein